MKAAITQSDYLEASNPYRLLAFFKFCECANMARDGIAKLQIDDSQLRALTVNMIEAMRRRAEQEALNVLDGRSSFVAIAEGFVKND